MCGIKKAKLIETRRWLPEAEEWGVREMVVKGHEILVIHK
jgi:hypothetical protein